MRAFLIFTFSFAISFQASAARFCLSSLFPSKGKISFSEARYKSESGNFDYKIGTSTLVESVFEADKILPELNPENRVILVVRGAHTFLSYRGYRIDSSGIGGIEVTTYLKKAEVIKGDIAAVIYDLPKKTLNELNDTLKNFEAESFSTCARASCSYIASVLPSHPFLMRPSALVKMLIEMKQEGSKIEFVTLNGEKLTKNLRMTQDIESGQITALAIPALGVAGLITALFSFRGAR